MSKYLSTLPERFWGRVRKTDGCWFWEGPLGNDGYGLTTVDYATVRTHRLAWELAYGAIPEGLFVLHNCDKNYSPGDKTYRKCCRPDHLFLGTAKDNAQDMVAKGRHCHGESHWSRRMPGRRACGERQGKAKLTAEAVVEIRRLAAAGVRQRDLAQQFGVCKYAIHCVVAGKTWRHVGW